MSLASTAPGLLSETAGYRRAAAIFGEAGTVDAYLRFEIALARVQGDLGVIPTEAARAIVNACRLDALDIDTLRARAARVGYPVVPLVSMLAELAGEHGEWVHYGATTQDVMDTAQVLQIRDALGSALDEAAALERALADLAEGHRHTPMAGRSKLQHAVPMSFGYKVALWLDQLHRCRLALAGALGNVSVLQFGGAIGTLSSLPLTGLEVRRRLAAALDLTEPDISWHVSRDRMATLTSAVAMLLAALGKMALDIAHMMSTELGELREPAAEGRGASSTMPQKRNPVMCEAIVEAARSVQGAPGVVLDAMLQEHERGLGHGYRERAVICDAIQSLSGAISLAGELVEGLEVDTASMLRNLERTNGLIHAETTMMRLAERFGRLKAHAILHDVARQVCSGEIGFDEALAAAIGGSTPVASVDAARRMETEQAMISSVLSRACPR
jgi:3-carboxy-cis,cis-muconate cycloisomerase